MDESLQELENELKALRPRRPSVLLRARVEHDLASDATASAREVPPAAAASVPPRAQSEEPVARRRYSTATTLRSWKWVSWQMAAAASVALAVSLGFWQWQTHSVDSAPARELAATVPSDAAASATVPAPARAAPRVSSPVGGGERAFASAGARDAYRPVKAANVLYDLQDEGPVLLEDNTPARRVRARYVDTYTWKNPATNASFKWSVPRDEVRVLPATFH